MQDIKKSHSTSRSRATQRDIASRVEQYEKRSYLLNRKDDEEGDRSDSAPIKIDRLSGRDNFFRRKRELSYNDPRTIYLKKKVSKGTIFFVLFLIVILTYIILMTYVFNSVSISFTPKHKEINNLTNKTFVFSQESTPGTVLYKLATATLSESKSLPMSLTKKVEAKASGVINIYNNYDSNNQKLVKNTRFETSDGKVYRTNDSVVVPGKKGDTPGTVEVAVTADSYGANYNIDPTDFTIPGFKGSDKYKGFYAKGKEKFSGGASGDMSIVSDSDLNSAKDELSLTLDKKIKDLLKKEKKDGLFNIEDSIQVVFENNEKDIKSGSTSNFTIKATGYMIQADKNSLARNIIAMDKDYHNENVRIDDISKLHFSIKDSTHLDKDNQVEVLVEGNTNVIWEINREDLAKKLLGRNSNDFRSILKDEDAIDKATPEFSSVWLSTFPDKLSNIKFVEELSKK